MPQHAFGKSIRFSLNTIAGEEAIAPYSLVSARIYSSEPSATQIADAGSASTGHLGSRITTWTVGSEPSERIITFDAITDPNPTSTERSEPYYIAVNFLLQSGGPEQTLTELIYLYRVDALTSRVTVTFEDVFKVEPQLRNFRSMAEVSDAIEQAKVEVFNKYESQGRLKSRMFDLHKLNTVVQYKALSILCFGLASQNAPMWFEKGKMHASAFSDAFSASIVGYDIDGDDRPDEDEQVQNVTIYIDR